ncbi:Hypothetical_protein [Hexamita inflata]|uniref:Hypothetical_protein n=1 Tax=Hexamita inflata TaxID=28002 RepID=A0AA86PK55_9EUKA|nr:Hypothetical protein HINF_LOCUS27432 [Hexamita inflata]
MKLNIYKIGQMIQIYFSVYYLLMKTYTKCLFFYTFLPNVRKVNKLYMMNFQQASQYLYIHLSESIRIKLFLPSGHCLIFIKCNFTLTLIDFGLSVDQVYDK